MSVLHWNSAATTTPKTYKCGYCNLTVGPDKAFATSNVNPARFIFICSSCGKPTFFDVDGRQYPGELFGIDIKHLPDSVEKLYKEARAAYSVNAFTPAVLACRKVLMHVGVQLGADSGQNFVAYVEYMAKVGYIPPNGKHWVDHIRLKSNEANHEIVLMQPEEAQKLIMLTENLLRNIYELPESVAKPVLEPAQ